jgi:hypothetical protein
MVHHLGHIVPKVPIVIRVGEVTPLEILLETAPTLSGRVVDELGRGRALRRARLGRSRLRVRALARADRSHARRSGAAPRALDRESRAASL